MTELLPPDAPANSYIEQALAEALVAYRVDGKYQLWEYADHAEEFYGSPQELASGMAVTEPMQAIAREAAVGRAVRALDGRWTLDRLPDGEWEATRPDGDVFCGATPDVAIAAALEAPSDE